MSQRESGQGRGQGRGQGSGQGSGQESENESVGAGTRFVVNLVGMVGLVFGVLPVVKYLLQLELFDFAVAPYAWLELQGGARYLPPLVVLAAAIVLAWWLERRSQTA